MLSDVTNFCRLILVRHPELAGDAAKTAVGAGPADLSRRGREVVLRWIERLADASIDAVVAADQPQASEPAAGFAEARGVELQLEPRLADQDMGRWQGRLWDELVQEDCHRVTEFFESFADAVPPGGENLAQAVERALGWWRDASPGGAGKSYVLVGPGAVLAGMTAALLGMRLSRCLSLQLPSGGIGVLDVFGNGVRLSAWNLDLQTH